MMFKKHRTFFFLFALVVSLGSCDDDDDKQNALQISAARIGSYYLDLDDGSKNNNAPPDQPIFVTFSEPVDADRVTGNFVLKDTQNGEIPVTISLIDNGRTISAAPQSKLLTGKTYELTIQRELSSATGHHLPRSFAIRFSVVAGTLSVTSIMIGEINALTNDRITTLTTLPEIRVTFSEAIDPSTMTVDNIQLTGKEGVPVVLTMEDEITLVVTPAANLADWDKFEFHLSNKIKGMDQETFAGRELSFYTGSNGENDFPVISDDDLLTLVQQQTFKYFYDLAEPTSGMARERNSSGNLVTSGGSGFGLMALIVGIERNFITRAQGIERLDRILDFLETADRFHGAWSHWIDGTNGNVIPFSANDNGGDLLETAFLVQGLITFRQYLDENDIAEKELIDRINVLWNGVEWDWYTQDGQNVLYWHWSPDKGWIMNHQLRGNNETMITYVLAASSPEHSISADAYHNGYASNGGIANGKTFYNILLPLGEDYGGPLFFTHYSFLGLDPRNLSDQYANYWTQNVNHSLINQAYVKANPKRWIGYSEESWGLTASDNHQGYSAHSPTNDLGVITPTAALSSFPYTPTESMKALKFFYYSIGDRLWGDYGFYDAYNLTEGWTANSFLAIDQGPIIVMIENHRTGLLWDLFMSAPEIQVGLNKLGFDY